MTKREQIERAWSDLLDSSREPTTAEVVRGAFIAFLIGLGAVLAIGLFLVSRGN